MLTRVFANASSARKTAITTRIFQVRARLPSEPAPTHHWLAHRVSPTTHASPTPLPTPRHGSHARLPLTLTLTLTLTLRLPLTIFQLVLELCGKGIHVTKRDL